MTRVPPAAAGALALAALLGASTVRPAGHAYPDGAPPATTGGFGEPTCELCHFGGAVNEAGGTLAIEGLPARYTPGETYRLLLRLRREGAGAAGFQLAARHEDGTQAGRLAPADVDAGLRVQSASGVQYAGHTDAGTAVDADGAAAWALTWTAPADARPVVLHAAANAADGDGSPLGDQVYTAEARTRGP